jgi:hypothetical protein
MYTSIDSTAFLGDFHDCIYAGQILRFDNIPAMQLLVTFTQDMLAYAFSPYEPTEIHRHLSPPQQTERFAACEREFSRSPEVKALWRQVFEAASLDPSLTARDRLHLRFQPHQEGSNTPSRARTTSTIAFHRDTWGTNLYAQTNWWAPVYEITEDRTFAIYPSLWNKPLANTSRSFDLEEVLRRSHSEGRNTVDAVEAIPHLSEPIPTSLGTPVVIPPGSVIAFSAAHAHAGVPNSTDVTRISLETRTLSIHDFKANKGAPNVDGHARWMAPGLFRRLSDGTRLNELLNLAILERYASLPASSHE